MGGCGGRRRGQSAERVKFATERRGTAVTDRGTGDEWGYECEDGARHVGEAVEESIIEK